MLLIFFFNDTATTEIYTLSLHDALPILQATGDHDFEREIGLELLVETARLWRSLGHHDRHGRFHIDGVTGPDRKSTRLNSSHANISYAVFCLKKKQNNCIDVDVQPHG